MNGELMQQVNGHAPVRRQDRQMVRAGNRTVQKTKLAALEADGAIAFAAHAVQGMKDLYTLAIQEAGGDVALMGIIAPIVQETGRVVTSIQRETFRGGGFGL